MAGIWQDFSCVFGKIAVFRCEILKNTIVFYEFSVAFGRKTCFPAGKKQGFPAGPGHFPFGAHNLKPNTISKRSKGYGIFFRTAPGDVVLFGHPVYLRGDGAGSGGGLFLQGGQPPLDGRLDGLRGRSDDCRFLFFSAQPCGGDV